MAGFRCSGFTLVEALVALALVAIALAAAGRAVAVSTASAGEAKLRILAAVVAENRLADLAARRAWPAPGLYEGTEQQAGIDFAWQTEVRATPHPLFRRVEVRVGLPGSREHALRHLVAVLPKEP